MANLKQFPCQLGLYLHAPGRNLIPPEPFLALQNGTVLLTPLNQNGRTRTPADPLLPIPQWAFSQLNYIPKMDRLGFSPNMTTFFPTGNTITGSCTALFILCLVPNRSVFVLWLSVYIFRHYPMSILCLQGLCRVNHQSLAFAYL